MPAISIIVPVYQVEKLLERCVNSLMNQTLDDIEIILVDDGSPDKSGEICDRLKEQDSRIQVIHKKNGGLSSARNAGMEVSNGKYIGFVDSDDDVEPNMFEHMVAAAEAYDADFVMSDYIRIMRTGERFAVSAKMEKGVYDKEDMRNNIYPSLIMGENLEYGPVLSVCNCIYNQSFLQKNKIKFAEDIKWSEDNLFNAMAGYCADRFVYLKGKGFYHYYQNAGTITTSYRPGAWGVYRKMNDYMEKFFLPRKDYDFRRQMKLHMIYYACNVIGMECRSAVSFSDAKVRIDRILQDSRLIKAFDDFAFSHDLPLKLKIQLCLMKHRCSGVLAVFMRG